MVFDYYTGKVMQNYVKRVIICKKMKNKVKLFRVMKNLSQRRLAELAGCSQQEISAIEKGEVIPTVYMALCIARQLEVKVEDLFMLEGG